MAPEVPFLAAKLVQAPTWTPTHRHTHNHQCCHQHCLQFKPSSTDKWVDANSVYLNFLIVLNDVYDGNSYLIRKKKSKWLYSKFCIKFHSSFSFFSKQRNFVLNVIFVSWRCHSETFMKLSLKVVWSCHLKVSLKNFYEVKLYQHLAKLRKQTHADVKNKQIWGTSSSFQHP